MAIAADQIRRANLLVPSLVTKSPSIASYAVGIRPGREGGYRMEVERRTSGDGKPKFILHAYGHGHNGQSMAIGTAAFLGKHIEQIIWDLHGPLQAAEKAKL